MTNFRLVSIVDERIVESERDGSSELGNSGRDGSSELGNSGKSGRDGFSELGYGETGIAVVG